MILAENVMLEDIKAVELQSVYVNNWTMIVLFFPGRSAYSIWRKWYSVFIKKVDKER